MDNEMMKKVKNNDFREILIFLYLNLHDNKKNFMKMIKLLKEVIYLIQIYRLKT